MYKVRHHNSYGNGKPFGLQVLNSKLQKITLAAVIFVLYFCTALFLRNGFCDILRLKSISDDKEGNEVEILEERDDSFIIKIPKDEIQIIKRKKPTDMKLWQEKKILWEDQGDYLTIFLPKDRIVTAGEDEDDFSKGAYFGKGKERAFVAGLISVGSEQIDEVSAGVLTLGKGKVTGKVLDGGIPVSGCKVKIVYVKGQADLLSKFFGGENESEVEGGYVFETETNEEGIYEFKSVPIGDYDIFWLPKGSASWIRKLTEKPEVIVKSRTVFTYDDLDLSNLFQ